MQDRSNHFVCNLLEKKIEVPTELSKLRPKNLVEKGAFPFEHHGRVFLSRETIRAEAVFSCQGDKEFLAMEICHRKLHLDLFFCQSGIFIDEFGFDELWCDLRLESSDKRCDLFFVHVI